MNNFINTAHTIIIYYSTIISFDSIPASDIIIFVIFIVGRDIVAGNCIVRKLFN